MRQSSRRHAFTLMEILLVIGLLAVVAAIAAPQFFRSGSQALDEARMQQMKTNYSTVKAAILAHLQRENILKNEVHLLDAAATDGTVADTNSRISRLITAGSLQTVGASVENAKGQQLLLKVLLVAEATGDDQLPDLNRKRKRLHVAVGNSGSDLDIDVELGLNQSFEDIWGKVKILAPAP